MQIKAFFSKLLFSYIVYILKIRETSLSLERRISTYPKCAIYWFTERAFSIHYLLRLRNPDGYRKIEDSFFEEFHVFNVDFARLLLASHDK